MVIGDKKILFVSGGFKLAPIIHCKSSRFQFRQLLSLHINHHLSLLTRGRIYSTFVKCVMLHAAEKKTVTVSTLNRFKRNNLDMILWICNVKTNDNIYFDSLLIRLEIQDVKVVLRTSRMRLVEYVERGLDLWSAKIGVGFS